MSMATLERAIVAGAKATFNNPKLKLKDILEWSCGEIEPKGEEVTAYVPNPGVWVTIHAALDKRPKA